jgi:hypothetical protein
VIWSRASGNAERHANSFWVPDHLDDDQITAFVLTHLRRQIELSWQWLRSSEPSSPATIAKVETSRELLPCSSEFD